MYKKIFLVLLMSITVSTAFAGMVAVTPAPASIATPAPMPVSAPAASVNFAIPPLTTAPCNIAFCSQPSQCTDTTGYANNGCNNCGGQQIKAVIVTACNAQYMNGIAAANSQTAAANTQAANQLIATCNANSAAPGCN